jgi:copper(I)-binding protein
MGPRAASGCPGCCWLFHDENKGGTQASIERVESSCCASVAMHQTKVSGDRVRMSHMDILVVPAHGTTSFNPGGAHLMLIAPSRPLRHHETVDIEFYCAQGNP